jgi:hypothetical protein
LGTYFSRLKATQPFPPDPEETSINASSANFSTHYPEILNLKRFNHKQHEQNSEKVAKVRPICVVRGLFS